MNVYSGRITGYKITSEDTFKSLRTKYYYYTDTEVTNPDILVNTKIANLTSSTPIAGYAKEGHGHARITYLSNSNAEGLELNNQIEIVDSIECQETSSEYIFNSIKEAQAFTPKCSGKYKLEVWGAQGGGRQINGNGNLGIGGLGGYSSGIISLNPTDTLYVYRK